MTAAAPAGKRPPFDREIVAIADYVANTKIKSALAYKTAHYCLMDTLGCGLEALSYPACTKLLGPVVPGTIVPNGARVPGTSYVLDPVTAAFNIGSMNRWLDYNDAWFGRNGAHPSDNLGGILATADYLSRCNVATGKKPLVIRDVLTAMIKAHEIQGITALENNFNGLGIDHVILVKIASTAVVTQMLGGTREEILNAVSNAWIDGQAIRTYRHAPNTGSRKSWAAGDATSRAVRLAMMSLKGEMGYPSALTAKPWGFYDVLFEGKSFKYTRSFGSYVMENVLFKIAYPAGFHGQSMAECAIRLHPSDQGRPAAQSGGSRSLHPVHRRDRPDLRSPHRGRLRRRRRRRSAHRQAARENDGDDGQEAHREPVRPEAPLQRRSGARHLQGRQQNRQSRNRIPARPPASPQRRYPAPSGKIQNQSRAAFSGEAAAGDTRVMRGRSAARCDAGQ